MKFPKISIVTPSYNQGEYIEQTILSVINQNYPNLEFIIIDGGSTDNTVHVVKKYEQHISYWVSEPDKGQSDAINKGLAKCTGDVFNWINSDDYLETGALQRIADAFIITDADIVCGFTRIFNECSQQNALLHRTELFKTVETTLVQQRINQPAMFYKLPVIKELGGINPALNYVLDLELWFRYLCCKGQKKIKLIDELIAHFRIHEHSKTNSHEERFKDEEKALWHYMLTSLKAGRAWSSFFQGGKIYGPLISWNFKAVNRAQLFNELSQQHLYAAFYSGNKRLSKKAYSTLLKAGRLTFNFQNIAMFVKLFIGNIPFRRFFKVNA